MSELENMLGRWSRRKLAALQEANASTLPASPEPTGGKKPSADDDVPPCGVSDRAGAQQDFDIAALPPIESITADTDISAFLRAEVPAALKQSALRRAWVSDPAIRDFIGIAENQWDFNDPVAIPGFGPLGLEEAARLAEQMFGTLERGIDRIAEASAPPPPTQADEIAQPEQRAQLKGEDNEPA